MEMLKNHDKETGRRVKESRKHAKLTQAKLSEECAVTENYISMIECGRRGLPDSLARDISRVCGVRLEYLLQLDDFRTVEELIAHRTAEIDALLEKRDFAELWYDRFIDTIAGQLDFEFNADGYRFTRSDGISITLESKDYLALREEFYDFAAFKLDRLLMRNAHKATRTE